MTATQIRDMAKTLHPTNQRETIVLLVSRMYLSGGCTLDEAVQAIEKALASIRRDS